MVLGDDRAYMVHGLRHVLSDGRANMAQTWSYGDLQTAVMWSSNVKWVLVQLYAENLDVVWIEALM